MAKLIGDPHRERNAETPDDRHYIVGNTDCLVWHLPVMRTYSVGFYRVGVTHSSSCSLALQELGTGRPIG